MNLIQIKANALLQLEMQKIINSRIKNTQITKTIEPTQNENTKQQSRLVNKEQQQIINETQQIKQTQKLDEETKQFIIQYIKEHKELTAAILTFIMNSKFKKMNLPKGLIEQFIKQNYEQYNGEQTPKHIDKQKENVNIQQKSNMEPVQNMVFNIATKTYQNALQKMTGLDHSKNSPAEICQIINSLEATKYDYFWYKVQGRNPSNSLDEAKYYFNNTYCQTLHAKEQQTQDEAQHKLFEKQSNINKKQTNIQNNDIISLGSSTTLELTSDSEQTQEVRLSQEQDQYIKKYIQEHTQITVPKMAMYLLKTKQLNLTNITSAQLQHFINNQSNQVQQDQSSLINKTKIQQQQLKVVYQPLRRALFRLFQPPCDYIALKFLIFSVIIQTYFLKTKSSYWLAHSFSEQEISGFLPYKSGKQKYVTQALIIFYCFHSDSFKLRQANAHHVQHSCYDNHVNGITTFIHRFKDIGRVSTEEKKTSRNVLNLLSWNQLCRLKGTFSWLDDLYNAFVNGWYRRESQELQQVLRLVNLNVILVRKHLCSSQTHRASLNRLSFVKEEYRLVRTRPADFNQSWSLLVTCIVFYFKQQQKLFYPPDLYLTQRFGKCY
ncbi:Hypothetical_protein [Hexamita inflata]|uniref:Hypothetical_protein n=1 Tax=Hexamita inflata TaxID=28002 RepID=A0AA86N7X6_9EUKA|nr:Hypothetical protein HINF_LOCUS2197 [Hexamita inflata]